MVSKSMLMKTKWFPLPHDFQYSFGWKPYSATKGDTVIVPLITHDEDVVPGTSVSSVKTNPENAAFAEVAHSHCWPESRINNINCSLRMDTGKYLTNNGLNSVRFAVQVIAMSFKEQYDALDRVSTLKISDVLQLQTESTDRQAYPVYNGVKVTEKFTGSATLDTIEPGLTATQILEEVDWNLDNYYDMLQYGTIAGKLKVVQSGLKWYTLKRDSISHGGIEIPIHIKSAVKRMNEYAFLGLLIHVPKLGTFQQTHIPSDVTIESTFCYSNVSCRYNEWNENFNFERV